MTRVLIVEDDGPLSRGLFALLSADGYAVDIAPDGELALQIMFDEPYAVIILDLGLPELGGFDVINQMRRGGLQTPVLVLTARDALEDRIKSLDLGADDYLLKPFEPQELQARLRALIRRSYGEGSAFVRIGSLTLDRTARAAEVNGRILELRLREWAVLETLATRAGKVVAKERLASEVFNYDDSVAPNALELYVSRLRRKLMPDGPAIHTMRGLGYMLDG